MNDPIITYRGASSPMSEISNQRVGQLEQQQGTQKIQYRGATSEMDLSQKAPARKQTLTYRGATFETEI
ncbi:MAG: DUF4278 domain-containing protein [Verrucomicrobiales bacterium]|nr:DUF4278 domain-containing protein [Verrucomicrobiales bacterium]